MLKITTTALKKACLEEFFLVGLVKDFLHGSPKALLPLEDRLFGDDVGGDIGIKASLEEQMSKLSDIVVGVVVHNDNTVVFQDKTTRKVKKIEKCAFASLPRNNNF